MNIPGLVFLKTFVGRLTVIRDPNQEETVQQLPVNTNTKIAQTAPYQRFVYD